MQRIHQNCPEISTPTTIHGGSHFTIRLPVVTQVIDQLVLDSDVMGNILASSACDCVALRIPPQLLQDVGLRDRARQEEREMEMESAFSRVPRGVRRAAWVRWVGRVVPVGFANNSCERIC